MATFTNTYRVSIKANPEVVFDTLADMARHAEWNDDLVIEALTDGPVRVGSRFRSWGWGRNRSGPPNDVEVTELQRPTHFAFVANDPAFGVVTHRFTLSADGAGTLVERTATFDKPSFFGVAWRLMLEPLVARPRMARSLGALKAQLENRKE